MASKTITILIDDLTGEEGGDVTPVTFALNGKVYAMDLSAKSLGSLEQAISPFVAKAKRVSRAGDKLTSRAYGPVREWLEANGYTVPARGRIPGKMIEAYDAAH